MTYHSAVAINVGRISRLSPSQGSGTTNGWNQSPGGKGMWNKDVSEASYYDVSHTFNRRCSDSVRQGDLMMSKIGTSPQLFRWLLFLPFLSSDFLFCMGK